MDIFEGRDIRVVARLFEESGKDLVITFTGRAAAPPVEKGFGETYLIKRRVSAVHFISKFNHWWQTPESAIAIDELRSRGLLDGGRRITLYGSSMGGYAALILSRLIKPKRIVVFSPQYSIDAGRVPFEKRWRTYAAKLKFDHDDMAAGIDHDAEIKVVYDPFFEPDRRHVQLVEKLRSVEHIPVRFAGHNTARTLEELGLITRVIDELLFGAFSIHGFVQLYRRARPGSCLFWYGLSQTLLSHGHRAGALLASSTAAQIMLSGGRMKDQVLRRDILRSAFAMACEADMPALAIAWLTELKKVESSTTHVAYAQALAARAAGDWQQVAKQLDRLVEKKGGEAAPTALKVEAISNVAGSSAALEYWEGLQPHLKRSPLLIRVQAHLLADTQDWSKALAVLRSYIRHDGLDPVARILCARCWFAAGDPEAAMKQLSPILHYNIPSDKLADEMIQLVEKGRGQRHAHKIRARHKRYKNLFETVMTLLNSIDWRDQNLATEALRSLSGPRPARAQVMPNEIPTL